MWQTNLDMVLRQRLGWCVSAWLLCAWLSTAYAKWDHVCTSETRRGTIPQGTCGQSLAELVQTTCMILGHGYSLPKFQGKRSPGHPHGPSGSHPDKRSIGHYILQGGQPEMADVGPFLRKNRAVAYLTHSKRFSNPQGIVCECCYHQCGFSELSEYCGAGDFAKRSTPDKVVHPQDALMSSRAAGEATGLTAFDVDLPDHQNPDEMNSITQQVEAPQEEITTESSLAKFNFIKSMPKKLLRKLYIMARDEGDDEDENKTTGQ